MQQLLPNQTYVTVQVVLDRARELARSDQPSVEERQELNRIFGRLRTTFSSQKAVQDFFLDFYRLRNIRWKCMTAPHDTVCFRCGFALRVRTAAMFDRTTRSLWCMECAVRCGNKFKT